ncbi:pentapeptide repeat-containing protein [Plebeiibacterium sediminum]|uniref:Pentapeptide repeat-containing protein n=1 Tax=Plebeiibacterium sediminum TaxID=2992112 RepID=A0AAE3SFL8_9BACT|nr:pentapeptide repeat-containing protein [Plebeiobacterium sediminum]MCW3787232.1 pentapeptide repeat-containing protein [Plebeiobacterium sediminum]
MNKLSDCAEYVNNEGNYYVRIISERQEYEEVSEIAIQTPSNNGEEPFTDIFGLISIFTKFREIDNTCRFNIDSEIYFRENIERPLIFTNCVFNSPLFLNEIEFIKEVSFINVLFKKEVNFKKSKFNSALEIKNCKFINPLILYKVQFLQTFNFDNIILEEKASFKEAELNSIYFNELYFKNRVVFSYASFNDIENFNNVSFAGKAEFYQVKFNKVSKLSNVQFHKLVDFNNSEFNSDILFHRIDFLDRSYFSGSSFNKQVSFLHCRVNSDTVLDFESVAFKNSLDISRANFACITNFWNIKLEEKNVIPSNFNLYSNDDIIEDVQLQPNNNIRKETLQKIRESYRIIKNSLRESGNEINALKFKGYEMAVYEKELEKGEKGKTILFFSKWSNNHGLSWGRGVLFTLFFTTITLYLFMLFSNKMIIWDWSKEAREQTLGAFVQFLNITNWNFNPWGIDLKSDYPIGYMILFVGRIFIGYGYYQTVSAFRRFGKN